MSAFPNVGFYPGAFPAPQYQQPFNYGPSAPPAYAPPALPAAPLAPPPAPVSAAQQQAKAVNAGYLPPTTDTSILSAQIAEVAQLLAAKNAPVAQAPQQIPYSPNRWYA